MTLFTRTEGHAAPASPPAPRALRGRGRRAGLLALSATTALTAVSALTVPAELAGASTLGGTATLVNPSNAAFLASGGSTTPFTVSLPTGAACTGDTAANGYHVFSYLVPSGTSVTSLSFKTGFPSTGLGFVSSAGTYYGAKNTAPTTGQIIGIPSFVWSPLVTSGDTTAAALAGNWEAGIACATSAGAVSDYWNTQVTFATSSSDPNGFTWSEIPGAAGDTFPVFTSASSTTFAVGVSGSFTPAASGTPAASITESGALPSGVTFSGGVLSGTPASGTAGTYPITFKASNGIGNPVSQSFTLSVGVPAAFTSASSATFTIGNAGSFTPTAAGTPAPTITESGTLPSGVTFSGGVLSGTPAAGSGGTYALNFTATNGIGSPATQSFTLTVGAAPTITSPNATTFVIGSAGTFTPAATGSPAPTITESGTLPSGVTFSGGVLSGTPAAGTAGSYPITLTASNGIGSPATQSFTLTVATVAILTTSLPSGVVWTKANGDVYSATITAEGGTLPYKWTITSGALPSGLKLKNGVISGKAKAAGSSTFTVQVATKKSKSAPSVTVRATFTITIT